MIGIILCFLLSPVVVAGENGNVIEQAKSLVAHLQTKHPGFYEIAVNGFIWRTYLTITGSADGKVPKNSKASEAKIYHVYSKKRLSRNNGSLEIKKSLSRNSV